MEQAEVVSGPGAAVVSVKLALSDEAHASLAAVRVAQESARLRARQQTVRTRIWFAALVVAAALAGAAIGPRIARLRKARAKAVAAARLSPIAPASSRAPAFTAASIAEPVAAKAPDDSLPALEPRPSRQTDAASAVAPTKAREVDIVEGCDAASIRHAWRLSPDACVRAFEADPTNASLALAVAQAHHAKAHFGEAAQWAKRALTLNPKAAEAYIIIAHDDRANGRAEDARAAYKRYLEVAPRGWHKPEARAALRTAPASPR